MNYRVNIMRPNILSSVLAALSFVGLTLLTGIQSSVAQGATKKDAPKAKAPAVPAAPVKASERTKEDHIQGQPIGKARLTAEQLEEEYKKTEAAALASDSDTRPGLAPWNQQQGANLIWPAKYYLPWPAGESHRVNQSWNGNNIGPGGGATHMKAQNYYAWDFNIVRGQRICAARDGIVRTVVMDKDNELDNKIIIDHADGECSVYSHVGKETGQVSVGDKVLRGQVICQGSDQSQHVHFVIWKGMKDMPCRFIDYMANNGVPQGGGSVTSGNTGVDEAQIAAIKAAFQKGEAAYRAGDFQTALNLFRQACAVEIAIEEYEQAKARIDEVRAAMMKTIDDVRAAVRAKDFKGAEDKLKDLKKKYGEDEAMRQIKELMSELKKDPDFRIFVAKNSLKAIEDKARQFEKDSKYKEAKEAYQQIVDLTDGLKDPELEKALANAKKKVLDLDKAAIFDDIDD